MSLGGSSGSGRQSSRNEQFKLGVQGSQSYLDPQQQANQQQLIGDFQGQNFGLGLNNFLNRSNSYNNALAYQGRQLAPQAQLYGNAANAGMSALSQYATGQNPYLEQQIAGLQADAGRFYNESVLPGITSQFASGGQRGSSRAGVAAAQAAGRVGEQFAQEAMNLRSSAYGMGQQAAGQLAGLGQQGQLGSNQLLAQIYGQGQQMAGNQFDQQQLAALRPFQIGAQVYGAPSVLSNSFGIDQAYGLATSKGKNSSSGLNIGLPLGGS